MQHSLMDRFLIYEIPSVLPKDMRPGDFISGTAAFCGLILAFAYFVMGWATNRMKDWESAKDGVRLGAPALTCWIAGAGETMSCFLGSLVFSAFYFGLNGKI